MKYTVAHADIVRAASRHQDVFERVHGILEYATASPDYGEDPANPLIDLLAELLISTDNVKELHKIGTRRHADTHTLIQDYLALGCRILQLDMGIVSHVQLSGNTYQVIEIYPPAKAESAQGVFRLKPGWCSRVLCNYQTLTSDDFNPADEAAHPLYKTPLKVYIGTPIWVNNKIFGTLNFSSANLRRPSFKASDIEFIEMMAHNIGQLLHTQQVEQASSDQDAILRLFVKHTPAAIAMFDTDIHYLLTSDRWLSDYGLEDEDLIGRSHYDVFPEIGDDWKAIHQQALKGHIDKVEEVLFERGDGKQDWIRWEVLPWYRSNQVAGIIMFTEVITKRKENELALLRSQNLYRSLIEHLPNTAAIMFDHDMRYTLAEGPVLKEIGYSSQDLVDKTLYEVLSPPNQTDLEVVYKKALQGESVPFEREIRGIFVEGKIVPVYDVDGRIFSGLVVIHNVTERKQSERALKVKLEEEHEFQSYLKSLHDITIELMQTEELDSFYKRAIELAREHLGLERIGLFLYDAATGMATGTYGMDMHGQVLDERHVQFKPRRTGAMMRAIQRTERFAYNDNVQLLTSLEPAGTAGWNAAAVLWNGNESLGWLTADNAISHKPATKPLLDILSLYALTLGTLLASKKTALALHESETRYRLLAENIRDEVALTNVNGEFLYVSPSVKNVLGYEPEELLGTSGYALVHPDDFKAMRIAQGTRGLKPNIPIPVTTQRILHKDGYYVWLESSSKSLFSDTGELMGFVTSSRDMTARKLAEDALKKSAAEIHDLYNNAPCGYHSVDANGVIVEMNDTELRWFGYRRDEIINQVRFKDLIGPESVPGFEEKFNAFKETGVVNNVQFELRCKDGSILHILLNATAVYDESGQFLRSRSTLFDMTQMKKAQDTLQKALEKEKELNELKSRFVSMASHEFRTPLATMLVLNENLIRYRHKMTGDQIDQRLDRMKEQIGYLTEIMNDVLELARLQSRQMEFNLIDLDALCRGMIEEFQSQPNTNQQFLYTCHLTESEVQLDRKLMRHVINNLVSNAIKYSEPKTTITVELANTESDIVLSVHDQGIGIPESDLKYLFEPFHRAENVGAIAGTGLGLMITKEAVELQGGTIKVESQVGRGTTVMITLPISSVEENNL